MNTYMLRPRRDDKGYDITRSGCHKVIESINTTMYQAEKRVRDWNTGKVEEYNKLKRLADAEKQKIKKKRKSPVSKYEKGEVIKTFAASKLIARGQKVKFNEMRAKQIGCSVATLDRLFTSLAVLND